jgi:hypothetical protein
MQRPAMRLGLPGVPRSVPGVAARAARIARIARILAMIAALVVVMGVALPAARAQREDGALPTGRIGASVGVKQGAGSLGSDFGFVAGIEAGYHPTRLDQRFSLGGFWAVRRSWFGDNPRSISGGLDLIELDFGARLRVALERGAPRFMVLGAGASLLRANVPLPPDDERHYVGPYASMGFEFYFHDILIGLEGRYGLLALGPGSFSVLASVSLGR